MQNPKKLIDAKKNLILLLNLIIDTNFIYKQKDIVNILIGNTNALLNSHNISSNINFGSGKSEDEVYWRSLIWHARVECYISKKIESFGSIKVTEKGDSFLLKPVDFLISVNNEFNDTKQTKNL